jgi:hypothetical protein
VLVHPRVAFHPCTCRLREDVVVVTAALIGYDDVKVVVGTIQGGDDCDRLLPLHRRVTTLDRYSNSSSAAQRV